MSKSSLSISSLVSRRPLRRSDAASKFVMLPCVALLLAGTAAPAWAGDAHPAAVGTSAGAPLLLVVRADGSIPGAAKNPLGYTDDGFDDARGAPIVENIVQRGNPLDPVLATPFAGAALSGGLHVRDRQTYPSVGGATAAELDLTYRF
jgi:hypothetical protein